MGIDDNLPLFMRIAQELRRQILEGVLPEESQAPSTNELAVFYRVNPATAAKGLNLLVDEGVLYKKRGIGMFVSSGARGQLLQQRNQQFVADFVQPLIAEANALEIPLSHVEELIQVQYSLASVAPESSGDTARVEEVTR